MTNAELVDRIAKLEKQLSKTAAGGAPPPEAPVPELEPARLRANPDIEALERRCQQLSQQLEAVEGELLQANESARTFRTKSDQIEARLKDREQLLAHAKDMWMKENVRASRLADQLTSAEDRLAAQERRHDEVADRYREAQREVRHLQVLVEGAGHPARADAGGAPTKSGLLNGLSSGHEVLGGPVGGGLLGGSGGLGPRPQTAHDLSGSLDGGHAASFVGGFAPGDSEAGGVFGGLAASFRSPMRTATRTPGSPATGSSPPRARTAGLLAREGELGIGPEVPAAPAGNNAERLQRLCLLNDAVLYEDEVLQIGIKAEYSGRSGQISVYFGNKSAGTLQNFTVQYLVPEETALRLGAPPLNQQVGAGKQVLQRITVALLDPFLEMPWIRVFFLLPDSSPRKVQTRLPVTLTKFMTGRELSEQEFFGLWRRSSFSLGEASSTAQLAARLRSVPLAHVARCAALGGALRLHHDIDASPCNLVFASQIAGKATAGDGADAEDLCLVRVEVGSGRHAGRARVAVRSADRTAARAVCDAVLGQLAEAGVPASGGCEGR